MSKLPIYMQILLGFAVINVILLILGQPMLLIEGLLDEETKQMITRVIASIGILSIASFYLTKSNTKANA